MHSECTKLYAMLSFCNLITGLLTLIAAHCKQNNKGSKYGSRYDNIYLTTSTTDSEQRKHEYKFQFHNKKLTFEVFLLKGISKQKNWQEKSEKSKCSHVS